MTKHDIYDEHEGFRLWNYMTCKKDDEGQEVWRITGLSTYRVCTQGASNLASEAL